MNTYNSYNNINFLLERRHKYQESGRFQNELESCLIRDKLINALGNLGITYEILTSSPEDCETIVDKVIKEIKDE